MGALLTPSNVMFVLGLLGILFTIYAYFRDPQVKSEKKEALLSQQISTFIESTDRRFKDIQENFHSLLTQNNNHIHTIDTKVENLGKSVSTLSVEVAKLSTIIEERIPRKNI